jgi:hypothetical protein
MLAAPERNILAGTAKGGSPACNHARGAGHDLLRKSLLAHARGIEAESPQARRRRAEDLQRIARFFFGWAEKKRALFLIPHS